MNKTNLYNFLSVSISCINITLKVITSPITLKYPNEVIAMNIIRTIRKNN